MIMRIGSPDSALAWGALLLFVLYISAAFVLRSVLQYLRTGDAGFRGISGPVGSSR